MPLLSYLVGTLNSGRGLYAMRGGRDCSHGNVYLFLMPVKRRQMKWRNLYLYTSPVKCRKKCYYGSSNIMLLFVELWNDNVQIYHFATHKFPFARSLYSFSPFSTRTTITIWNFLIFSASLCVWLAGWRADWGTGECQTQPGVAGNEFRKHYGGWWTRCGSVEEAEVIPIETGITAQAQ